MPHLILLGDSIFDNARYVPGELAVIDQLRQTLPADWRATLLAIDGNTTTGVAYQLRGMPADATHLAVSVGGNDALGESMVLRERASNVAEALQRIDEVRQRFRSHYCAMLKGVLALNKPTAVCTIYDAVPGLGPAEQTALAGFNDIILREAFAGGLPVIDLRLICDQRADYSSMSPIEPSFAGGAKIVRALARMATSHDFSQQRSCIYL